MEHIEFWFVLLADMVAYSTNSYIHSYLRFQAHKLVVSTIKSSDYPQVVAHKPLIMQKFRLTYVRWSILY